MRIPSIALLTALLLPLPVFADTVTYTYTYTYTGNDFTGVWGVYTTSDSVTGEFTLSAPLADNLDTLTAITPTSFSFSDGVQTITNSTASGGSFFEVETNASGAITQWDISLVSDSEFLQEGIETVNLSTDMNDESGNNIYSDGWNYSQGAILYSPGTWTTSDTSSPVPEPSSLILLGSGLAGCAGLVRRRLWRA